MSSMFVTVNDYLGDKWPDFLPRPPDPAVLDHVWLEPPQITAKPDDVSLTTRLLFERELVLGLPGLDAVSLVLAPGSGDGAPVGLSLGIDILPQTVLRVTDMPVALRFGPKLLRPMRKVTGGGDARYEPDPGRPFVQLDVPKLSGRASRDGITFDAPFTAQLPYPVMIGDTGLVVDGAAVGFHRAGGKACLVLQWKEGALNRLLGGLVPNLGDRSPAGEQQVTLRLIIGGDGPEELRLDWQAAAPGAAFTLPGLSVGVPATGRFSLLLLRQGAGLGRAAFVVTLTGGDPVTAGSTFAWGRDGDRELHNDEPPQPPDKPLFSVTLKPADGPRSVVLLDVALGEPKLPGFFRQLTTPIAPLDLNDPAALCTPVVFDPADLQEGWSAQLSVNIDAGGGAFTLPFLKQGQGGDAQFLQLYTPTPLTGLPITLPQGEVGFDIGVRLRVLSLGFDLLCRLTFDLGTFALKVDHDRGIELRSPESEREFPDLFGLRWRFKGKDLGDKTFHYFTIATKDYHYQIQQPQGAALELDFTRASEEPITFSVRDFALTPKGVTLAATVTDRPARLNGLRTRFRFTDSGFVIRENRIADFTIAGSGPLPPDLVGDATADIALQFAQRDGGNLTLVQGAANLRGVKLLDCKGTRFQFSVDALGLRFVDDGAFHLYFTVTGSAQFVPAPGDDPDGPLALLGKTRIDLVQCPLTGDARVIGKHVKFLIELPKPTSFGFLGCFEMELRAIGFVPQCEFFGGDGAMLVTGQLKFAQGPGDTPDSRPDYHELFIGLPLPGEFVPRIHFTRLAVNLAIGAAFRLNGVVDFVDEPDQTGLVGEGLVQIQGLPAIAASFGFLRVRRGAGLPWLRAWFLYLEIRQVSFMIPVIQIYLREIGMGFGYRFTIAAIKAADAENDVRKLLKTLEGLSRTQGDLSKRDRWAVDLEEAGQDPRWTIVLRAMISQTSASASPLRYEAFAEADLACVFLVDAIIAFRSDLTFFMSVRGWFNTNYADYVGNRDGARENPILSGFVLLSPRQKRFLAHISKPEGGKPGDHPPLPDFVRDAIADSRFSATLLIEPGLFHYELGWPNMLRWHTELGPLAVEVEGGFIFRVSTTEMVLGTSFLARGRLQLSAGVDLGLVGMRISATARVAFGARYIGVIDFRDPTGESAVYGAIGLEVQVSFAIEFWIKIPLVFTTIRLSFRFSLEITFSAGLEIGVKGLSVPGVRGVGTVGVSCCGHSLQATVRVAFEEDNVQAALDRTKEFLSLGLEATEVEPVPGTEGAPAAAPAFTRLQSARRPALPPRALAAVIGEAPAPAEADVFHVPGYVIFVLREPPGWDGEHKIYFVLLPQGERLHRDAQGRLVLDEEGFPVAEPEPGFLPPPPAEGTVVGKDFALRVPKPADGENYTLLHYEPLAGQRFVDVSNAVAAGQPITWAVNWAARLYTDGSAERRVVNQATGAPGAPVPLENGLSLAQHLANAFKQHYAGAGEGATARPVGDPGALPGYRPPVSDPRVQNPSDSSFEAAVRGAYEQFSGSPFLKRDPQELYGQLLESAFDPRTTIYAADGAAHDDGDPGAVGPVQADQQAHQLRGVIIHDIISDLRAFHAEGDQARRDTLVAGSTAFQMGLVFAVRTADNRRPAWLDQVATGLDAQPAISQRERPEATGPGPAAEGVRAFNVAQAQFSLFPPEFEQVRQYSDASTIALTWDLGWRRQAMPGTSRAQNDPDHHLAHYLVRRRALDGDEAEHTTTVKPVKVLHRHTTDVAGAEGADQATPTDTLSLLQPRFQVVDHFPDTADDRAALPREGRGYVYTITPVDFSGGSGRPLTLIATRYPNTPPAVPVDGDLTVAYSIAPSDLDPAGSAATPEVMPPRQVYVEWSEPARQNGPAVPIRTHRLIFRRESTVPIGSYGLDSTTQRGRTTGLPTSNARPLPADIKIDLDHVFGPPGARAAVVPVATLRERGVLPDGAWRPEAWRVYFQTVSDRDVPSALAPVQLRLAAEAVAAPPASPAPDDRIEHSGNPREERRPAELEWLPRPAGFDVVRPEDERAEPGLAHAPMPLQDITRSDAEAAGPDPFVFTGDIGAIVGFRPHPLGIRAIRFRWNQGPSGDAAYPLELNAGYRLYELDIDAATTDTFASATRLAEELRLLQEVQMLPADDLPLVPGDTLNTSQWEAWYPGAVQRRRRPDPSAQGVQDERGPWYSWQDSYLEWPTWEGVTRPGGKRETALHPLLERLVERLRAMRPGSVTDPQGRISDGYAAALQVSPPTLPNDLADFLASCPPGADRYGWGVLQRLGLAVTFSLHDPISGAVRGPKLLELLQGLFAQLGSGEVIADPEADPDTAAFAAVRRHLHVELLFQPGRSIQLGERPAAGDDLLALVQISLRPTVRQRLRYRAVTISGRSNTDVEVRFTLTAPCSLVGRPDGGTGQVELEPQPSPLTRTIRLPLNGEAALLLRGAALPATIEVRPSAKLSAEPKPFDPAVAPLLDYDPARKLLRARTMLSADQIKLLRPSLAPADLQAVESLAGTVRSEEFGPTDERANHFTVATGALAKVFATADDDVPEHVQWLRLKYYLETLNSNDPKVPDTGKVSLPTGEAEIAKVLPDVLAWTARFFDAGGAVYAGQGGMAATGAGPWAATAYPRAGSPAPATPDAGGRLTYTQLLEDRWAHTLRYYFQPYGRYDLLWQSLRRSPTLFPGRAAAEIDVPAVKVDPAAGGLDVVIERTQAVDAPLILGSRRLDEPATPARPPAPGAIWEVIVAQHHEQTLAEHNQTLVRRLAFRQIAFSLLRRFGYTSWYHWVRGFAHDNQRELPVRLVEDEYPDIPDHLPDRPDHLVLDGAADQDELRGLDLPERVGDFSQGVLALQWRALPFYYDHRLLVIAQTDGTVSKINSVTQRDLTYRSPLPSATVSGADIVWHRLPPFPDAIPGDAPLQPDTRVRSIAIPLRRFWDSLSDEAQQRWPAEQPDPVTGGATARKPGALPDPEVVYQIVELFSGNIEVQAECFYDPVAKRFAHRQLGERFLVARTTLMPPAGALGDFPLMVDLVQVSEEQLGHGYSTADLPLDTRNRTAIDEHGRLLFAGVMTRGDRDALAGLMSEADAAKIRQLFEGWYATEPVGAPAGALPGRLGTLIDFLPTQTLTLVWEGPSDAAAEDLRRLPGDSAFTGAIAQIVAQAAGAGPDTVTRVEIPAGPEQIPDELQGKAELARNAPGTQYTAIGWSGAMTTADIAALRRWARFPEFAEAVEKLIVAVRDAAAGDAQAPSVTVPFTVAVRPIQAGLSGVLAEKLLLGAVLMRYHGMMRADDPAALLPSYPGRPDQLALRRLHRASQGSGMRGRSLVVRARRGSAAPSGPRPIDPADV
ncbi:hypothetical protein AGRA3207_007206 [Actinomadura graeca]|uniref:Uncharacterized protein n=1 Tax=Actinomadura graeca TaxID=2750812 RepID=A0ABX8R3Q5_9ACTN|nr:hypothetical protein [Actinomadura graeca]QXJ25680.1 hypothetical protein AGRA3207_007206 [Actinomadura graeca]